MSIIESENFSFSDDKSLNVFEDLKKDIEDILHDQNDINQLQSQFNSEVALQIEVINDALDQLREKKTEPENPIGFRVQ